MMTDPTEFLEKYDSSVGSMADALLARDDEAFAASAAGVVVGLASGVPGLAGLTEKAVSKLFANSANAVLKRELAKLIEEEDRDALTGAIAERVAEYLNDLLIQLTRLDNGRAEVLERRLAAVHDDVRDFRRLFVAGAGHPRLGDGGGVADAQAVLAARAGTHAAVPLDANGVALLAEAILRDGRHAASVRISVGGGRSAQATLNPDALGSSDLLRELEHRRKMVAILASNIADAERKKEGPRTAGMNWDFVIAEEREKLADRARLLREQLVYFVESIVLLGAGA